jgi:hypothetical protein
MSRLSTPQTILAITCDRCAAVCGVICCLLIVFGFSGCATLRWPRKDEFPAQCRLPKNPTTAEVIAHVNANVSKIQGWRSYDIKIRASGVPISLAGSMIVEREHRLRLEVTSPMGKEVDFGSNDEMFWIWSKRNQGPGHEPAPLICVPHVDLDLVRQELPMPFEPPWLMEALGVSPLSAEGVQMEGEPGNGTIRLVSQHQLDGRAIRKTVKVDACHGRVLEHSVTDARGETLVRTVLGDHRIDRITGAVLPRYVKLDWPQTQMSLAMEFGSMEVNPTSVPDAVWQLPQMPHTPVVDLGARYRKSGRMTTETARPRSSLVAPERVLPIAGEESFELPQVPSRPVVELKSPDFEPPELPNLPGRARLDSWPGGEE